MYAAAVAFSLFGWRWGYSVHSLSAILFRTIQTMTMIPLGLLFGTKESVVNSWQFIRLRGVTDTNASAQWRRMSFQRVSGCRRRQNEQ